MQDEHIHNEISLDQTETNIALFLGFVLGLEMLLSHFDENFLLLGLIYYS